MQSTPVIALDFPNRELTLQFLRNFNDEKLAVKVGMELYYGEGPSIITAIKDLGHDIFLDLKLHDIPSTVGKAMERVASLGVDMVNVHAAGGRKMMEYALEGLEKGTTPGVKRPLCIAVTQLTSTSEEQMRREQLIQMTLAESVIHYSQLAKESGLDGVVCSVQEVQQIKNQVGPNFCTVTPGIRLGSDAAGDQTRIATPFMASEQGSDFIVVGRSITTAEDPVGAYHEIVNEWERKI